MSAPLRLVVLVSGSGSLLQALLDAQSAGTLPAREVEPAALGQSASLGWMAAVAPANDDPDAYVTAASFALEPDRPAA